MNDKHTLNNLLDFKDLRKNRLSVQIASTEQNGEQSSSDHQTILRSFKQLRQKLKNSQKQNSNLKEEAKIQGIRLRQNQEALQIALASNVELKAQVQRQGDSNLQMKKKFSQIRQKMQSFSVLEEELSFTKQALLQSKLREQSIMEEKKKAMQLFLQQKMQMQEEICKLAAKVRSNQNFISQLEDNCVKSKQHNYRLQNKVRKMSISVEQSTFNNHFNKQNFQTQHLIQSVGQLQKQISTLKGKLAKEKQRRYLLEEQMIMLEQSSGINNVKAVTFEGESQMLAKKQNRLEKKVEDLNNKLQKSHEEKIVLEEEMIKYQTFSEELVVKLKPLLSGDLIDILSYYDKKLKSMRNGTDDKQIYVVDEQSFLPLTNITEQQNLKCNRNYDYKQENYFASKDTNNYMKNYETGPSALRSYEKKDNKISSTRFTFGDDKQNEVSKNHHEIQGKIRRQREQMEKRLKEKWFQKKFQCSMPSELYKLRAQYITTFIDR